MFKMIELFNTTNKKQLKNLSVYIYKAFEMRQNVAFIRDVNKFYEHIDMKPL